MSRRRISLLLVSVLFVSALYLTQPTAEMCAHSARLCVEN